MPATHELRVPRPEFRELISRRKRYVIAGPGRAGAQINDVLDLREWNETLSVFTGRILRLRITHVLPSVDSAGALAGGYVVYSLSDDSLPCTNRLTSY